MAVNSGHMPHPELKRIFRVPLLLSTVYGDQEKDFNCIRVKK
jgi:hypothetical protein